MDIGNLITSFVLSLASYFIISHFIYRLSGRKDWAFFFLGIIFLSSLFDFLPYAFGNYAFPIILLVFVSRVLPVMLAAALFTRFTGGLSKKKIRIKRSHFKEPNEDIYTTSYIIKIVYIMFIIAILISVLSYFFMDGALQYVLFAISLFVVIYGIVKLYQLRFFKNDKVVIIIGKEKENVYMKTIDPKLTKITIKDIYQNENYLIDKFATIQLYEENHFKEKHYLYWIATSKAFEIEDLSFIKTTLGYEEHIMGLMKYHDAIIKLNYVKNRYEVLKAVKFRK
ncbi:hypothetical protein [Mariniplasma anaerobium]|uniref:Uncharacterized protein n=1 Tax=Mariniplasma anaerobium TaxID=2735436 RepID=A0A7U9XVL6_9MOLU|nr:hypothetical protein [Mariniplasma anaerobium]BCR36878.1 hypothetical protein MPAN_017710 [Mariniplasma anaerobium]